MKKTIIFFTIILAVFATYAQSSYGTEVTGDQKTALVSAIEKAHSQLSTLSANFTQEKTSSLMTDKVVQKGKLRYKSPKQLRWEYTSPKAMAVIFTDGKVLLKTDKGNVNNPNKMLNEMGSLIINTINGSFLKENKDFKVTYYKNGNTGKITVKLVPINKRIKTYYSKIVIELDGKTHLADKVAMHEVNGDITTITFSDKKSNGTIPEDVFK